ncbi:MAG: hypothetical protein Q8O30_09320 [Candidatus Omnitrophota bacterium]|nr:hypothetical protein [Candidatus Omnitrophota bacterium]
MKKKILIFSILFLCLALAGGVFLFWQSQKAVTGLNAGLPEGVRVVKSIFGKDWKIVNKIDGYEFTVPKAWEGVSEIEYIPKRNIGEIDASGLGIKGVSGVSTLLSLDVFFPKDSGVNLLERVQKLWESSELVGELTEDTIENIQVVKGREDVHLGGTYIYFIEKGQKMYALNNGSEEYIRGVILNGKW